MKKKYRQGDDIRLSQIVGVFGVGGLRVQVGGLSMICAGLDHWYKKYTSTRPLLGYNFQKAELMIKERRLESLLGVDYFLQPPEYRDSPDANNAFLPVPFFRFPTYSYCSYNRGKNACGRMQQLHPSRAELKPKCRICAQSDKSSDLYQVNIIVACPEGHIDEFPWYEWAHNSINPTCKRTQLVFMQSSGTGVTGQAVKCLECNAYNDLSKGFTKLLDLYGPCKGMMPWHGPDVNEPCGKEVQGIFSNQTSAYQPLVRSSLFIPIESSDEIQEIDAELDNNRAIKYDINGFLTDYGSSDAKELVELQIDKILQRDDGRIRNELSQYSEEAIKSALINRVYGISEVEDKERSITTENEFRFEEYKVLKEGVNNKYIKTETNDINEYSEEVKKYINKVVLVKAIVETRALAGFTRLSPLELDEEKAMKLLWNNYPSQGNRWLPATQNFGEGIFIEFNSKILDKHGKKDIIKERLSKLVSAQEKIEGGPLKDKEISLELIFIHTLTHLLINEIAFESGYSVASISERMYVEPYSDENNMNGVLIYTSQGDTEGTMGGLVTAGQPARFNELFLSAIINAGWCSTDPVCNEVIPQGPFNLNLGACYSCSLLPETSCELINSYLDRGVVVGTFENPDIGVVDVDSLYKNK